MGLRKSPGSRPLQVTLCSVLAALLFYVLPTPALAPDPANTSLWACATAASMALVFFKEQR
jgi:hypothetical protein